jgi:hypothetical protein
MKVEKCMQLYTSSLSVLLHMLFAAYSLWSKSVTEGRGFLRRICNFKFAFCILHFAFIFFLAGLCLNAVPLSAQVVRLPDVMPDEEKYPGQLVSHPDSSAEILQSPGETAGDVPAEPPQSDVRPGMFQKIIFNDTSLVLLPGSKGFGQQDLDAKLILALPCPTKDSPLVITPGFAAHFLDGPCAADLPSQLYEAYTQFRWLSQVTPQWGLDLAVTPGVFSDFDNGSNKSFRLTGHAAAAWTWNDTTKIVLGAAYLDRFDVNVIPIGGVIWKPNEDLEFDLLFPEPKISRRIHFLENLNKKGEYWGYIAGEFAGDVWTFAQNSGGNEQVLLRDSRVILGLEHKTHGGLTADIEVGYVFNRAIRFTGDTPSVDPANTVLLRARLMY